MMMIKYLKYLIKHRWYVMLACWREGLYWQGIIHDWSKFTPSEYPAYAAKFFGPKYKSMVEMGVLESLHAELTGQYAEYVQEQFGKAWLHHIHMNPHHSDHWVLDGVPLEIPNRYVREMLCDWHGAGRAQHGRFDPTDYWKEPREWYLQHKGNIKLHPNTRAYVEKRLGVFTS